MIIVDEIKVSIFPHQERPSNFGRVPIARTCVPMLELEDTYDSLPELAEELNQIIASDVWVMDIM